MSKRDRWTLGAGAAALVAIGWFLHPTHDHPSHLALGLLWPGTVYLAGLRLARELVVAEADYVRDLDEASAASVDRSFSDGQRIVLDLAREARDDARAQLRRIEHDLDAVLRQAAARRLHEIDRRLASVMAATPRRDCSDHVGATSEPVLAPLHSSRPGPEVAELAD